MFKKLVFCILIIVALLYGLEALTGKLLMENINFKTAYITRNAIDAQVLVHGPCEPEWMIDPRIIDSTTGIRSYNLSLNHSDFADNYLHLYFYLQHQQKPAWLFLYTTPISFDRKLANTFNTYRFAPFLSDPVVYNTVKDMDTAYARCSWLPFMRYAYYSDFTYLKALQGAYYKLFNRKIPEHPDGYAPALSSWNTAISGYNINKTYYETIQWNPLREKYFRKTIELALQYGCKVIVYESPIYVQDAKRFANRGALLQRITNITQEYKVPFWKYDTLAMANDRNNFFSAYNTTYVGSCIFSRIFANDIRKLIRNRR